jgi:hypothetical protein
VRSGTEERRRVEDRLEHGGCGAEPIVEVKRLAHANGEFDALALVERPRIDRTESRDGVCQIFRRGGLAIPFQLNTAEHDAGPIGRGRDADGVTGGALGGIELSLVVQPAGLRQRISGAERGGSQQRDGHEQEDRAHLADGNILLSCPKSLRISRLMVASEPMML